MILSHLLDQAQATFGHAPLTQADLLRIRTLLDRTSAEELDLGRKMASLDRGKRWTAEKIFEHPAFHLGLFLVPEGNTIPLHDHPGMAVLLKVLWGTAEITALDWLRQAPGSGLARLAYHGTLDGADQTLVVLPDWGNLHRIRAVTDCAFLDLFSPPYAEEEGRACRYYRESGSRKQEGRFVVRLVPE